MSQLTPKQQRFVDEYLIDLNASAAARRAGYSARTAEWQGPQLLGKTHVAEAVAARKAERAERTKIDADWVLRRLADEARADISDLFDDEGILKPARDWPEAWRRGLVVGVEAYEEFARVGDERVPVGVVRKVRLQDRSKVIDQIGKHVDVQAFRERHEHSGPNGGPIPVSRIELVPLVKTAK